MPEQVVVKRSPSVLKRQRQNEKRRMRNRYHMSRLRSQLKKTLQILEEGDAEKAAMVIRETTKLLDKSAHRGLIHRNKAANSKSRLMKKYNALINSK